MRDMKCMQQVQKSMRPKYPENEPKEQIKTIKLNGSNEKKRNDKN